jgi:Fe-S cluster biogenesis protein NfuA/nitrite reductase/ring-hydroxylating ferredoxin subunit
MAHNARNVGERIEELLGGLSAGPTRQTAEELVRLLVGMYGEGLERVITLVRQRDPALVAALAEDDVVESLLLLHDLHPIDVDTRIQRALDKVRPYLGSHAGGVEFLGVDDNGVAQLRLEGSCHGCPSSTLTVKMAIEGALLDAAPEITAVEVAGMTEPQSKLLQVGMGPPTGWVAPEGSDRAGWTPLPDIGPPTGKPVCVTVDGMRVLVCSVRGTLYAYRDACGSCGSALAESTVDGSALTCDSCGARFDVRLAGKGLDDRGQHLDPVPLLSDSHGTRVAVPRAVPS